MKFLSAFLSFGVALCLSVHAFAEAPSEISFSAVKKLPPIVKSRILPHASVAEKGYARIGPNDERMLMVFYSVTAGPNGYRFYLDLFSSRSLQRLNHVLLNISFSSASQAVIHPYWLNPHAKRSQRLPALLINHPLEGDSIVTFYRGVSRKPSEQDFANYLGTATFAVLAAGDLDARNFLSLEYTVFGLQSSQTHLCWGGKNYSANACNG